ncbi:MAG: DHH family phosphoesterase, partial [Patescibacteria group bacterium]
PARESGNPLDFSPEWFSLKDMSKVVERILRAFLADEKIIIFSDYDADGIPGAVVLHDLFKKIGYTNFENYIPHRHEEGFGLNVEAVKKFAAGDGDVNGGRANGDVDGKAKLIITIDCGIADVEPARLTRELGIDLIITDHHEPLQSGLPEAYAILNPKQSGCEYPEKMLCGAGVIFKLVQAILIEIRAVGADGETASDAAKKVREKFPATAQIANGWEKWLLDMVGLATLSDMVPLTGENRAFAYYGLKVLRISPRIGLGKLLSSAGSKLGNITEDDISFTITPRINAASRMGIPMEAFSLLSTKNEVEAGMLTESLNLKNDERKTLVASMAREINKRLEERMKSEALREVIVMGHPDWRPSLLGLVANTLKDDHSRPVFLWGREGGNGNGAAGAENGGESVALIKGSCRSDHSASVVALMTEAKDLFINFGGHTRSGGFSMLQEHIHFLEDRLVEAFKKFSDGAIFSPQSEKQTIDKILSINDANWQTWRIVERLGPFGTGNPKPVFLFDDAVVGSIKQFGKQKNHLELSLEKRNGAGRVIGIRFFSKPSNLSYTPYVGGRARVVATLEKSMFRNFPELRLRVIDVFAPN